MPTPAALQSLFAQAVQHQNARQFTQAESLYKQLLTHLPTHPDIHLNLGNVYREQNRLPDAIASYQAALTFSPNHFDAHYNLGVVFKQLNLPADAAASFQRALAIQPHSVQALTTFARLLIAHHENEKALPLLQRAVEISPNSRDALNSLAGLLTTIGRPQDAIPLARRAIATDPNFAAAHLTLGEALEKTHRLDDAANEYQRAIDLDPSFALAHAMLGSAHRLRGSPELAIASFRRAISLDPANHEFPSSLIFAMHCDPTTTPAQILAEQKKWSARHAPPPATSHANDPTPDRRLRIGYVSADFHNHAVGRNLLPLFQHHDKDAFEIFAYSNDRLEDDITTSLRSASDHWQNILPLDDAQAFDLIQSDRIDILIDLSQHTAGNRLLLFAKKPAPIQIAFAGFPGGTGLAAIDYRISDPNLDPLDHDSHYSETTLRLPHNFWLFNPTATHPVNPLPALTTGHITFGAPCNPAKINSYTLSLWSKVLAAVENSRLTLYSASHTQTARIHEAFSQSNIAAGRVNVIPMKPYNDYMSEFHRIDIALDPFPYTGYVTTLDSLYLGVPVLTLTGQIAVSRSSFSILTTLGLSHLAAADEATYIRNAQKLAQDLDALNQLRQSLRQKLLDSPLTNAKLFTQNIEAIYRDVWQRWCARQYQS